MELSRETGRQIGILIARTGVVEYVVIGDEKSLVIPQLNDYPLGRRVMRGLRLVHTHLKNEQLTEDDLADLSLLRLDIVAALLFSHEDPRISVHIARLAPPGADRAVDVRPIIRLERLEDDLAAETAELETLLERRIRSLSPLTPGMLEKGILISAASKESMREAEDSIMELRELARTAHIEVIDAIIQRQKAANPRYLIGEGKMRDVIIRALGSGATMLIFDQELTPAQIRSISTMTELKVIDRSQLILDIFAGRAKTQDGKVQVELAQLKYLLPRLSGRGVQMSRLMGGIGGRGPGETKLEIDRRRIRERIASLEKELKELSRGREERRKKRTRRNLPIISIVGYTNAGKSTLLNALTQSDVFTEDLLFATLDTSTRRLRFPREREVIITDTVGFIRSLPKSLTGAFKATLEEMQDADLLLHIVDASNSCFEARIEQVERILDELGLGDKQKLLVFNKSDLLQKMKKMDTIGFLKVRQYVNSRGGIMLSACDRSTLAPLLEELQRRFWPEG